MTTIVELEAIAARAVWPAGATSVVALVEVTPGGRLANGSPSGIGSVTRFGAAYFDGRRRSAPIALFDQQRDAFQLIDLLSGRTLRSAPRSVAPRSQAEGPAERGAVRSVRPHRRSNPRLPDVVGDPPSRDGRTTSQSVPTSGSPGAPIEAPVAGASRVLCKACGRDLTDLPLPRNGQRRRTCDDACRQAFHRGQRAPIPGVVAAEDLSRLSRLPRAITTGTGPADADPADPGASQPELALEE